MATALIDDVATAVSTALASVLSEDSACLDPLVRRSDYADFQSNIALSAANQARTEPRELAARIAAHLTDVSWIASADVAGPGFLNITVPDQTLWNQLAFRQTSPRLGIGIPNKGQRTVIDYSAPNIAKEMHVGHLRTTIIGDCLSRVLEFLGVDVIRQNHLGDWGTQFGMLIQYLDEHPELAWRQDNLAPGTSAVSALDELYQSAATARS